MNLASEPVPARDANCRDGLLVRIAYALHIVTHDHKAILSALQRSRFRSGFRLREGDLAYAQAKGIETLREHARAFVVKRLAPAQPANDGKQTPMRGHPVFVAQHATATCCRKCLEKWHKIAQGCALTESEVDGIVAVIELWLRRHGISDSQQACCPAFLFEQREGRQPCCLARHSPTDLSAGSRRESSRAG